MSDLRFFVEYSISKDGFVDAVSKEHTATMSFAGVQASSPDVGTSSTQIATASLNSVGFAFAQSIVTSTVTTATITIGRLDGTTLHGFCKLKPNEGALLRLADGDYAAEADADGAKLFISIAEG